MLRRQDHQRRAYLGSYASKFALFAGLLESVRGCGAFLRGDLCCPLSTDLVAFEIARLDASVSDPDRCGTQGLV